MPTRIQVHQPMKRLTRRSRLPPAPSRAQAAQAAARVEALRQVPQAPHEHRAQVAALRPGGWSCWLAPQHRFALMRLSGHLEEMTILIWGEDIVIDTHKARRAVCYRGGSLVPPGHPRYRQCSVTKWCCRIPPGRSQGVHLVLEVNN